MVRRRETSARGVEASSGDQVGRGTSGGTRDHLEDGVNKSRQLNRSSDLKALGSWLSTLIDLWWVLEWQLSFGSLA